MVAKRSVSPTHVECQKSQKALSFLGFGGTQTKKNRRVEKPRCESLKLVA